MTNTIYMDNLITEAIRVFNDRGGILTEDQKLNITDFLRSHSLELIEYKSEYELNNKIANLVFSMEDHLLF